MLLALSGQHADDWLFHDAGLDVAWLGECFKNLASRAHGDLNSLSIVIVMYVNAAQAPVSPHGTYIRSAHFVQICSQTFSCTMQALAQTTLSVRSLHLFSPSPAGRQCGLLSKSLGSTQWIRQGVHALSSLRCLSIRVVVKDLPMHDPAGFDEVRERKIRNSVSMAGLVAFLTTCSSLQELHLSQNWQSEQANDPLLSEADAALRKLVRREEFDGLLHVKMHRLQTLSLSGFGFGSENFRTFLESHSATLRTLELFHMVFLAPGDISLILTFLSSDACDLHSIRLSDLHDRSPIIFLGKLEQEFARISSAWSTRGAIHQWDNGTKRIIDFDRVDPAHRDPTALSYHRRTIEFEFGCVPWWVWLGE
jgi:hypothetical protein